MGIMTPQHWVDLGWGALVFCLVLWLLIEATVGGQDGDD